MRPVCKDVTWRAFFLAALQRVTDLYDMDERVRFALPGFSARATGYLSILLFSQRLNMKGSDQHEHSLCYQSV
jgi:hypothetical protein